MKCALRVTVTRGLATTVSALAIALAVSCGARSQLLPEQEPCVAAGEVRPCANACGVGQQRCEEGIWQRCEVARSVRECTNTCGGGVQACEDGEWSACEVAVATRQCMNQCGSGIERCEQGAWQGCDVPPVRRACMGTCGGGAQTCEDGRWGECDVPRVTKPCQTVCGSGEEVCEGGQWRACNAPQPKPPKLHGIIRDFDDTHPDFEIPRRGNLLETGLVAEQLGLDDKPVYTHRPGSVTTSGAQNFDQWFRDVPGVNRSSTIELQLQPSAEHPGLFVYSDHEFFPIDGDAVINQNRQHNFHFTLEVATRFQYVGGEVFRFSGDDDMWVFINRRLAIDLGGIHNELSETVVLDEQARTLGLVRGETYSLHFFFAERHTNQSHFTIETSISEPGDCPSISVRDLRSPR